MSFKSSYIYTFFILALIVIARENFDFTTGDREAFLNWDREVFSNWTGWDNISVKNTITAYIFTNLKYFGEVIFCILYYKNVFKLSSQLLLLTRIKDFFNRRIVYYSILLCLFAPVTIIFTSFAGKDIIGIFLASELCIEILNYKSQKKLYKLNLFNIFKLFIYVSLLFILRNITAIFLLILFINIFIKENYRRISSLIVLGIPITVFSIILFKGQIYDLLYEEIRYQWSATYFENATFSPTNPFFTLSDFFLNSYQMITSVSVIHFNESFIKASLLLFNSFLTYIITLFLSVIYFFKNLKIKKLFFFKALFIISFFSMNGFLSQNNPGGAIRYMSSAIPIYTTFVFAVLPE